MDNSLKYWRFQTEQTQAQTLQSIFKVTKLNLHPVHNSLRTNLSSIATISTIDISNWTNSDTNPTKLLKANNWNLPTCPPLHKQKNSIWHIHAEKYSRYKPHKASEGCSNGKKTKKTLNDAQFSPIPTFWNWKKTETQNPTKIRLLKVIHIKSCILHLKRWIGKFRDIPCDRPPPRKKTLVQHCPYKWQQIPRCHQFNPLFKNYNLS